MSDIEDVPGQPHPGYENGHVADRGPGYIPGEPDEGFENGTIPDSNMVNAAAVGSSNADPVEVDEAGDGPAAPPRGGAGSGVDEWRAYAAELGIDVADDATRDDIIAAVDEHQN